MTVRVAAAVAAVLLTLSAAAVSAQQAEESSAEAPVVEIPLDKQQLIGVRTVEVAPRQLSKVIRTVGRVEYDERKLATVNTKFEAWIEKLYVDYTGKEVKRGERLAEVYSPELFATQQEFLNLVNWTAKNGDGKNTTTINGMLAKDAEDILAAARQRLRLWDITDAQIRRIERTRKPIRTLTIHSPANGVVVTKAAVQGMRVMPGEKLFDIADLSTVWITSEIYEHELPLIRAGATARFNLSSLPEQEFSAPVEFVYPTLAGETRTVKVRLTVRNPGGKLKPQMFTNVEIKAGLGKRLAVPDDAVLDTGTRQIVYVDKGEGYFEPREVKLGLRAEGYREVLGGLRSGEKVARSATFLIDSEAQLKGVR
jgi:Cu(I)/Ag(I) efflux system membrane fusion protein